MAARPSPSPSAQRLQRRRCFSSATVSEREYFIYLATGHGDNPTRRWPVMLFLHGGGERGDGLADLDWVLVHGPLAAFHHPQSRNCRSLTRQRRWTCVPTSHDRIQPPRRFRAMASYRVEATTEARKELRRAPGHLRARILQVLHTLEQDFCPPGSRQLDTVQLEETLTPTMSYGACTWIRGG